jgi:hypothetical protein
MTTLREAAQAALDAFDAEGRRTLSEWLKGIRVTMHDLGLALAATEPTQEPVAWQRIDDEDQFMTLPAPMLSMNQWRPLYAHPAPPQTPMTDEQIAALWDTRKAQRSIDPMSEIVSFVRAIERHHAIGPARGE